MDKRSGLSLNKYIAQTGFCSRREADAYIRAGRVSVNQIPITQPGKRVAPGDLVALDGEPLKQSHAPRVYLAFHKPPGVSSTTDPRDPSNIIRYIGYPKRIFPIGRLDKDSQGLILLTNDGDMVNKILRATNGHEKEYRVEVDKPIDEAFLRAMAQGVPILDTVTEPAVLRREGRRRFRIILKQGLNRQIRRMCAHLGYKVQKLTRLRIMHLSLDGLAEGHWRHLNPQERQILDQRLQGSRKTAPEATPSPSRKKAAPPSPSSPGPRHRSDQTEAEKSPRPPRAKKSYSEYRKQKNRRKGKA